MTDSYEKFCAEDVLKNLKDFQRNTVEYLFERLYGQDQVKRFLVADEVGLGKTMVAKGIIAKAIERLLEEKIPRIDVLYICSNAEIAKQNINRLNYTGEDFALASRITMLPLKVHGLRQKRVNFISFTPQTSFNMGNSSGIVEERVLLYYLLKEIWGFGSRKGPKKLFLCNAGPDRWEWEINRFDERNIDAELKCQFLKKLTGKERKTLCSQFAETCDAFSRYPVKVPDEYLKQRDRLIGELRSILANSCIDALEPDLVILDEFQRFKSLLDGTDPASELAHDLFNFKDARVLLLSATPYKMFTLAGDVEEDHYEDFIRTVGFLLDSEDKTEGFKQELKKFRQALLNCKDRNDLLTSKHNIESTLRSVMVRTERLNFTKNKDGMITEVFDRSTVPSGREIKNFAAVDKLSGQLDAGDVTEYWKSAPYLLNFMDSYKLKEKFIAKLEQGDDESLIKSDMLAETWLSWDNINRYRKIDPANMKLAGLINKQIENGAWKYLWIPPSIPYYSSGGPWKNSGQVTKSLVFSSWQIVPKIVATLCSYEAERRMVTADGEPHIYASDKKATQQALLNFKKEDGSYQGMVNMTLMYPCLTLAREIDPLRIVLENKDTGGELTFSTVMGKVENQIRDLLTEVLPAQFLKPNRDERWYWVALALLDRKFYGEKAGDWLNAQVEDQWQHMIPGRSEDGGSFAEHVDHFTAVFNDPPTLELGYPPDNLAEVLAMLALGSPAVCALRGFLRAYNDDTEESTCSLLSAAAKIAVGFRSMFNMAPSIGLIRSFYRERYWQAVLKYGAEGNLQAVMDEYFHVLREFRGVLDKKTPEAVQDIAKAVEEAVSMRTSTLGFDEFAIDQDDRKVKTKPRKIRCRYALRFGKGEGETGDEITREDQVRIAFNSPFRPFILSTTSIGQEGLDFHLYCHSIYHWNLPTNPVDLEQREGRIHRYKGHVIRKNMACKYNLTETVPANTEIIGDPWRYLFEHAVQERGDANDIVPFWICESEDGPKVERHVPMLPLSRDRERFKNLKKTLAFYRLAFGQPRQDDLVSFLSEVAAAGQEEELSDYRIDLTPK